MFCVTQLSAGGPILVVDILSSGRRPVPEKRCIQTHIVRVCYSAEQYMGSD